MIHRDIKPANLIWRTDGRIALVDFGAARDTSKSQTSEGSTIVGTYGFMAPEQFRGHAVPQTDLYGVGATCLWMLSRRTPAELPEKKRDIDDHSAGPFQHTRELLTRAIALNARARREPGRRRLQRAKDNPIRARLAFEAALHLKPDYPAAKAALASL